MVTSVDLKSSYDFCARHTKTASTSFYYAIWSLPFSKRQSLFALYAWLRILDDIGDESASIESAITSLNDFQKETFDNIELRNGVPHPSQNTRWSYLWPALAHTLKENQIPHEYLQQVIAGVRMDQVKFRYQNTKELHDYCYMVASVVGFMVIKIFGAKLEQSTKQSTKQLTELAKKTGLAFQITNILRDIKEDAARNRIYIPLDLLKEHQISENDLLNNNDSQKLRDALRKLGEHADQLYDESAQLLSHIPQDSKRSFILMFNSYYFILKKIKKSQYAPFETSFRLSAFDKIKVLWGSIIKKDLAIRG